jgi:hypothetical protein
MPARPLALTLGVKKIAMLNLQQILPLWAQITLAVVPALAAIFAGVGLMLNVRQSRRTDAQARAALVASCLKGFAEDEEIQRAFYTIEYSEFEYGPEFHNSTIEREIDKLLRHFANIALAWQARLLTTNDIRPIQPGRVGKRLYRLPTRNG